MCLIRTVSRDGQGGNQAYGKAAAISHLAKKFGVSSPANLVLWQGYNANREICSFGMYESGLCTIEFDYPLASLPGFFGNAAEGCRGSLNGLHNDEIRLGLE
jgi:hypothetical protein